MSETWALCSRCGTAISSSEDSGASLHQTSLTIDCAPLKSFGSSIERIAADAAAFDSWTRMNAGPSAKEPSKCD